MKFEYTNNTKNMRYSFATAGKLPPRESPAFPGTGENVESYTCNMGGNHELMREDLTDADIAGIRQNWAGPFLLEKHFKKLFWINPTK